MIFMVSFRNGCGHYTFPGDWERHSGGGQSPPTLLRRAGNYGIGEGGIVRRGRVRGGSFAATSTPEGLSHEEPYLRESLISMRAGHVGLLWRFQQAGNDVIIHSRASRPGWSDLQERMSTLYIPQSTLTRFVRTALSRSYIPQSSSPSVISMISSTV